MNRRTYADDDPLSTLHDRMNGFSRGQRKIARFLLSRLDEAVFLTAAKLAKQCETSETTVIRLARTLGYRGFPELQEHLQAVVRQKLAPGQRVRRYGHIPRDFEQILDQAAEHALGNIRETRRLLASSTLQTAAQAIADADTRYVVGLSASAGPAQLLGFYLGQIQPRVFTVTEGGFVLSEALVSLSDRDTLLAVSFPRYTRWTVDCIRYARDQGAMTIALTDSQLSPAAQAADIALASRTDALFSNSYVSTMFVIDALIGALLALGSEEALARLEAIEQILSNHDFFYSPQDAEESDRDT